MAGDTHVIRRLYAALAGRDPDGMAACYAPGARFTSPLYPDLRGPEVAAMWRLFCDQARGLEVHVHDVDGGRGFGSAQWLLRYEHGPTGRKVECRGEGRFALRDGLVTDHADLYDLHSWMAQALGWKGRLMGWTRPLEKRVQREARRSLDDLMASEADGSLIPVTP